MKTTNLSDRDRKDLEKRIAGVKENREAGFVFIIETAATQLKEAVSDLGRFAGSSHDVINRVVNAEAEAEAEAEMEAEAD